ncbi:MAG: isoprenoid biosynthesis glyoxalase ElbB [Candidatus Kapaibacteriales bacterium]
MAKVAVLLAGSGVYDGSEIHEAVLSLLALEEAGHQAVCIAKNKEQYHVVNHISGEEMPEKRNVLIESARIARGNIRELNSNTTTSIVNECDALFIPGGFGAAKNLNKWAISGSDGEIDSDVKELILQFNKSNKAIGAVCMGPTVLAKAFEGSGVTPTLTVGTTENKSPYDIKGISEGMEKIGSRVEMKDIDSVATDKENKLVTGACYMMDVGIGEIRKNTKLAVEELTKLIY